MAIDFLIGALLLDDEDFGAQAQNGIELFFTNIAVMFTDPVNTHGGSQAVDWHDHGR
ncbi:hypothetical protein D3C81_2250090 [compost metagenome]